MTAETPAVAENCEFCPRAPDIWNLDEPARAVCVHCLLERDVAEVESALGEIPFVDPASLRASIILYARPTPPPPRLRRR